MKIFEAIREDHEKQRTLLGKLLNTSGDTKERHDCYKLLKTELKRHAVAEERHFYKPLLDADRTIEKVRHGIAEHHDIDELIEKLDDTDMDSPAWLAHFKNLREQVLHHLAEEEHETFQQAGRVLTEEQKEDLAEQYREEMQTH